MSYDNGGKLESITNTMGGKNVYGYNDRNQVISERDALGNVTRYQYDDADNLIMIRNAKGEERHLRQKKQTVRAALPAMSTMLFTAWYVLQIRKAQSTS